MRRPGSGVSSSLPRDPLPICFCLPPTPQNRAAYLDAPIEKGPRHNRKPQNLSFPKQLVPGIRQSVGSDNLFFRGPNPKNRPGFCPVHSMYQKWVYKTRLVSGRSSFFHNHLDQRNQKWCRAAPACSEIAVQCLHQTFWLSPAFQQHSLPTYYFSYLSKPCRQQIWSLFNLTPLLSNHQAIEEGAVV